MKTVKDAKSQRDLEEIMRTKGQERGERKLRKAVSRGDIEQFLEGSREVAARDPDTTDWMLQTVLHGIREFVDTSYKGTAGRRSAAAMELVGYGDIFKMTVAACAGVLNAMAKGDTNIACAIGIASLLEDDEMVSHFLATDPGAAKWVGSQINKRQITRRHHKKKFIAKVATHKGARKDPWTREKKLKIGATLLDVFVRSTKLVYLDKGQHGKRTVIRVHPAKGFSIDQILKKSSAARRLIKPVNLPMIEPPKPWRGLKYGGYHNLPLYLVKGWDMQTPASRMQRAKQLRALRKADLTNVIEAVNTLDAVPFRVNTRVLDVLEYFFNAEMEVGSLPDGQEKELEPFPEDCAGDYATLPPDKVEKRVGWRKRRRDTRLYNAKVKSRRLQVYSVISTAKDLADREALYFPHQLDFRGRVYDVPAGLNPQGPDHARALLEFAEAKPIETDDAMRWLQVHGANCYGKDKCSMADRIQWVKESYREIQKVAADPLSTDWWTKADKPWLFLAWCFDYVDVYENEQPSRVAVALDGSCNGLQHLSSMLRDPVGAEAVNLKPSALPQDIYQRVADVVIADLNSEKPGFRQLWAKAFLSAKIIDRKLCKRSVMVMPYGGTFTSTKEYVEAGVRDRLTVDEVNAMFGDDQVKAINYLADTVHKATRKVVTKAAEAMIWLQEVTRVAAKAGLHIHWSVPHGFQVHQVYFKQTKRRIDIFVNGNRIRDQYNDEAGNVDVRGSCNSISPNFVHALDACAMMMTTLKAKAEGVTSFRMVHDDYGTHAADTAVLSKCLREAFVELYRNNNVLETFLSDVKAQLPENLQAKLPDLPEFGTFNIEEILQSEFFFA